LNKFALILAYNRPSELEDLLGDIDGEVDYILIIDNASEPPMHTLVNKEGFDTPITYLRDMTQPANLPRLWNIGFDQIKMLADETWKIAVLTDDVRVPAGWFVAVSDAMDRHGAAAGCSTPFPDRFTRDVVKRQPDRDLLQRLFGPAFVIRGEAGLRANEDLKWWWNDTDLDWKARGAGGMVIVPGYTVTNRYPNESTVGELAIQAGRDRGAFKEAWGWLPW